MRFPAALVISWCISFSLALSVALTLALSVAQPVAAEPVFDSEVSYAARHTIGQPEQGLSDNDLLRARAGLTFQRVSGQHRVGLEAGNRVESDRATHRRVFGLEALTLSETAYGDAGWGARLRLHEGLTTSVELAYLHRLNGAVLDRLDLRGGIGGQLLVDDNVLRHRSQSSAFAIAEASYFLTETTALRVGAEADREGEVFVLGVEQGIGRAPVSLYVTYAEAFESYRGFRDYNDLTVGLRYYPGRGSLRDEARHDLSGLMRRAVEVQ